MLYDVKDSDTVFKGVILTLKKQKIEIENGIIADREIIEKHHEAVCVIAVTDENKMLFVKQYRPAVKEALLEVPAGLIDHGEDPETAALRELEEETGYKAARLESLGEIYVSPGYTDEKIYIYKAYDLEKFEQKLDHDEFLEVVEMDIDEVKKTHFKDSKTLLATKFI